MHSSQVHAAAHSVTAAVEEAPARLDHINPLPLFRL